MKELNHVPKVSIVLPVYNGERYLAAALESCLLQTFRDFEVVVVDDCSTDSTPVIIKEFASIDERIRIVTNNYNLKLPASLNAGFTAANGELYTWTSDDNILEPEFLSVMVAALVSNHSDIVYGDYTLINEAGLSVGIQKVVDPRDFPVKSGIGASFIYRKEVHKSLNGFDSNLFLLEDYDFWIRAYLKGFKFYKINSLIYKYRQHEQSLTHQKRDLISRHTMLYKYELRSKLKLTAWSFLRFRLGLLARGIRWFTLQQTITLVREICYGIAQYFRR